MKNMLVRGGVLIGAVALLLAGCSSGSGASLSETEAQRRDQTYQDRVFALSQVWAEAANLYGYWDFIDVDYSWDDAYYRALGELTYVANDYDYYLLLERFMAGLLDGHVSVRDLNSGVMRLTASLPIELKYIEGNYVLVGKDAAVDATLGSVLVEVDGQPIDAYIADHIAPLVGLQTPLAREQKIAWRLMTGQRNTDVRLAFQYGDGAPTQVSLTYGGDRTTSEKLSIYDIQGSLFSSSTMEVAMLSGDIAYVGIKTFGDSSLVTDYYEKVLPAVAGCRGMIIDLRYCPGGSSNNGFLVLASVGRQVPGDLQSWAQVRSGHDMAMANYLRYPQLLRAFGSDADMMAERLRQDPAMLRGEQMLKHRYYAPTDPAYAADDFGAYFAGFYNAGTGDMGELIGSAGIPAVVLLGHEGGSATDTVASLVKSMGTPTVGTHTAGYTGENLTLPVYHNWAVSFSAKRTVGADNQPIWNCGIPADIYVEQTLAGALLGVDDPLRAALEHLETLI